MIRYKLVTQDYKTRVGYENETLWKTVDGKFPKIKAKGQGNKLCTNGVIHSYSSPLVAVFLNPVHANIDNPRLLETECSEILIDDGTKAGHKEAYGIREIKIPEITEEQRIKFAILCALEVYKNSKFSFWAKNWLSGVDRTKESAHAADANAADADAYAADADAAHAAAYAAATDAYDANVANIAVYAAKAAGRNLRIQEIAEEAMK